MRCRNGGQVTSRLFETSCRLSICVTVVIISRGGSGSVHFTRKLAC